MRLVKMLGLMVAALMVMGAGAGTRPVGGAVPTVYLIGDSTVRNGSYDNGATAGQWGWGHMLHYHFDTTKVKVVNDAMGGTSSRSYWESPRLWGLVLPKIKAGDYVIMQFGHNDSRGSLKGNGEEEGELAGARGGEPVKVHSYGWYMRQYIRQVKEKGAVPIVCSLIPRNRWTEGKVNRNTADYALWAKQAAEQEGAFFVPLNELVADEYDKEGQEKVTAEYFPKGETVHPNWMGARLNAELVVKGIKGLEKCGLKGFLKDGAEVPVEADVKAPARGELGPAGTMPGR